MLKKAKDSEDLPLPVRPQIPTWRGGDRELKHLRRRRASGRVSTPDLSRHNTLHSPITKPEGQNYLLARLDVGVDVLEHGFEHGVVAHAQVLDLDRSIPRPRLGHLRSICRT